jgi:hypothetical protein
MSDFICTYKAFTGIRVLYESAASNSLQIKKKMLMRRVYKDLRESF